MNGNMNISMGHGHERGHKHGHRHGHEHGHGHSYGTVDLDLDVVVDMGMYMDMDVVRYDAISTECRNTSFSTLPPPPRCRLLTKFFSREEKKINIACFTHVLANQT